MIDWADKQELIWRMGEDGLGCGDILFNPRTCEKFIVGSTGCDLEYIKPRVNWFKFWLYRFFPRLDKRIATPFWTDDYFVVTTSLRAD